MDVLDGPDELLDRRLDRRLPVVGGQVCHEQRPDFSAGELPHHLVQRVLEDHRCERAQFTAGPGRGLRSVVGICFEEVLDDLVPVLIDVERLRPGTDRPEKARVRHGLDHALPSILHRERPEQVPADGVLQTFGEPVDVRAEPPPCHFDRDHHRVVLKEVPAQVVE